jgi:hypothetical protein
VKIFYSSAVVGCCTSFELSHHSSLLLYCLTYNTFIHIKIGPFSAAIHYLYHSKQTHSFFQIPSFFLVSEIPWLVSEWSVTFMVISRDLFLAIDLTLHCVLT